MSPYKKEELAFLTALSNGSTRRFDKEEMFTFMEKVKGIGRPIPADHFTFMPFRYHDQKRDYRIIFYENGIVAMTTDYGIASSTRPWKEIIDYVESKLAEIAERLKKPKPEFIDHFVLGIRRRRNYERAIRVFGEEPEYSYMYSPQDADAEGQNGHLNALSENISVIHRDTHKELKKRRERFNPDIDEGVAVARTMSYIDKSGVACHDLYAMHCPREFNSCNPVSINRVAMEYGVLADRQGDAAAFELAIKSMNETGFGVDNLTRNIAAALGKRPAPVEC